MENHVPHVHPEGHAPHAPKVEGKKNLMMALGAVAVILIVLAAANFNGGLFSKTGGAKISADEAKAKAEDYINKNLVTGTTASVTSVEDYNSSLYKLKVKVGEQEIDSYITKDGLTFFPQGMDIDGTAVAANGDAPAAQTPVVAADIPKSGKPAVEVFVMSHCPYGTQVEKGLLPVMATLKDKADIKIKFVNYVMHGADELNHNTLQYCIDREDPSKYQAFLTCFLKDGNADGCVTSTGVNKKKVDSCISETDKKYKLTEVFNDKTKWTNGSFPPYAIHDAENTKYGVQGSPTLVINGKQVESERSPAGLLATICAAFDKKPAECDAKLDTATPGAGFGTTAAAATGGANAACAPS